MLYLAALRAQQPDDLFAAAMESAKHGEDILTLRLTSRLLKRETFHTQAMMLRGCALVNLGRMQQASRIFGRLCGLAPEDTVCEWLHKLTRDGKMPQERMELGGDVSVQEGAEGLLVADGDDVGVFAHSGVDGQDAFALLFFRGHFQNVLGGEGYKFFAVAHAVHDGLADHAEHHPHGYARAAAAGSADNAEAAIRFIKKDVTFAVELADSNHCNIGILHIQHSLFHKFRFGWV